MRHDDPPGPRDGRASPADPVHLVVGHVTRPHGIRGEVAIRPLTDHPEGIYAPGVVVLLADARGREPDLAEPALAIEGARPFRQGYIVAFEGIEDRNHAERLRGRYLLLHREDLAPLAEDEVFYHELLGMRVETVAGEEVGIVREVYELQPSDLLEVRTPTGHVLVPFHREVVVEVHKEARRLVIDPPEGLLDL